MTVYTKTYSPPPFDTAEILRYAGAKTPTPEISVLLQNCLKEAEPCLTYQVCYGEFPLTEYEDTLDLTFAETSSASLRRQLHGCGSVILFAATVGLGLDRLIVRHGQLSPAKALLFQAMGAERIEALCDCFCQEITDQQANSGKRVTPRFSPGYGDLPLTLQQDIFRALDCPRKIGLTLNESLLMSPSKSVTALMGIF